MRGSAYGQPTGDALLGGQHDERGRARRGHERDEREVQGRGGESCMWKIKPLVGSKDSFHNLHTVLYCSLLVFPPAFEPVRKH